MFCQQCGRENPAENKFCEYCGASLGDPIETWQDRFDEQEIQPDHSRTYQKDNSRRTIFIIIAVAVAAIIAAILVFVFVVNGDDSADDDTTTYTIGNNSEQGTSADTDAEPYFTVVKTDITWEEAYDAASDTDSELACIHDSEDFREICRLADDKDIKVLWVGARRDSSESWDEVDWIDGTSMTYTKWYDGEPSYNYDGVNEKYLMIFKVEDTWYFNDAGNDISDPDYNYTGKMGYAVQHEGN